LPPAQKEGDPTMHTPGPWTLDPSRKYYAHPVIRHHGIVVVTLAAQGPANNEECRANARLIAAAPELLEALKRACNHLIMDIDRNGKGIHSTDSPDALVDFHIVIAKAEGRTV
jgi:hypothetical protein